MRHSKLTPEMLAQIDNLLGVGCTIEVTCDQVGITRQSFYNWKNESLRLRDVADRHGRTLVTLDDIPALTFFDAITRAQARAQVMAVIAFRSGLVEHHYTEVEPYTYRETRLRKDKSGEEIPYIYEETRLRTVERTQLPDWRAGLEYLKRRDPTTWNPPQKLEITWQDQAVEDIRNGLVEFNVMVEKFDDFQLVASLFRRAGVPIPAQTGEGGE